VRRSDVELNPHVQWLRRECLETDEVAAIEHLDGDVEVDELIGVLV